MKDFGLILFLFGSIIFGQEKFVVKISGEERKNDEFIRVKGVQFISNGRPFYANGFNAYWLMYVASDLSQRWKVSSAFEEATKHNLKVVRTWAFSDGGYLPLQYSPGSYNEIMFQGLDFVISEARKYGMKLILSFVNNYGDFGGKKQYVEWAKNTGQQIHSEDVFFTNPVVKQYYRNHIKVVLTRHNTITRVPYKDDPTIMAWELMNEPRCNSDVSGRTIQEWVTEMASYLKSIDKNHLLEAGLEGFYGQSDAYKQHYNLNFQTGTDFIANNQIGDIDFATVHSYPDQWFTNPSEEEQLSFLKEWLNNHIQDAQVVLRKPVIMAEFGKSSRFPGTNVNQRDEIFDTVYSAILTSASGGGAAAGGLFWQLLTHGLDNFRDGYEIVFDESPTTANIIRQQSQILQSIH